MILGTGLRFQMPKVKSQNSKYLFTFQYLPVLMYVAVEYCIPKVSEKEMEDLAEDLKKPGDKRDGQVLAIYDRVFQLIKRKIEEFDLKVPVLFQSEEVNRLALTYFNGNREVNNQFPIALNQPILVSNQRSARISALVSTSSGRSRSQKLFVS